ncbi:acyltransferase [Pseudomonadota bacterium]
MSLRSFISGLSLLRNEELVKDLGERRFHLERVSELQRRFPKAKVSRDIILVGYRLENIELGDAATLCAGTVLAFGDELNGFGSISIGQNSWIGQHNNLRAGGGDIVIGQDCLVSQFCSLVASNHSLQRGAPIWRQPPTAKRGVVLEDDVWLGAGVHVLPGVRVGRGAVVGAGSVVTHDVPEFEIWAGAPARKIGMRE